MRRLVDESRRRDLDPSSDVSKIFILGFFITENFSILVGIIMYGEHYFKMASFIVDFSPDVGCKKNGALVTIHTSDHRRLKISGFTPSCEALGHLLRRRRMTKIRKSRMSGMYGPMKRSNG